MVQGWGLLGAQWEDVGDVGAGGTGVTGVTGGAVHLAAQANTRIPGHPLSASYASAWKGHLGVNWKPFTLLIDPTPHPVLFLSFLPDS